MTIPILRHEMREYTAANGHLMIGQFNPAGEQINSWAANHSENCQCWGSDPAPDWE